MIPEMLQKKLRTLFKSHDMDRSGYLDTEEFKACLFSLDLELTESEIIALMATADTDGDGGVSFDEFAEFCTQNLMHLEREKLIRSLQKAMDEDAKQKSEEEKKEQKQKDQSIEQTSEEEKEEKEAIDFLQRSPSMRGERPIMTPPNSRMTSWSKHRVEGHLKKLFDSIDVDHRGFITKEQLKRVLEALGLTPFQFDLMMADIDVNQDGVISFDEFLPVARDLIMTFKAKNKADEDQKGWEEWCEENMSELMRSSEIELEGVFSTIHMLLLESADHHHLPSSGQDNDQHDDVSSIDSLSVDSLADAPPTNNLAKFSTFRHALMQTQLPKHEVNHILILVHESHGKKEMSMDDVIDISDLRFWVYKARKLSLQRRLMENDLFSSAPRIILEALDAEFTKKVDEYKRIFPSESLHYPLYQFNNEELLGEENKPEKEEGYRRLPKHTVFECMMELAPRFHLSSTEMIAIVSWALEDMEASTEPSSTSKKQSYFVDSRSPSPVSVSNDSEDNDHDGHSTSSSSSSSSQTRMYKNYAFWHVESDKDFVDIVTFFHFAGQIIARMNKVEELFFRNFILEKDTSSLSKHELMGGLTLRGLTDYLSIELSDDNFVFKGWVSKMKFVDILIHAPCLDLTQKEIENITNTMKRKRWAEVEEKEEHVGRKSHINYNDDDDENGEEEEDRDIVLYWADFIPRAYDIILNIKYQTRLERRKMMSHYSTKSEEQFQEQIYQMKALVTKFI
jgi:Ca2+-binding EF-hand superfamily protein